MQRGGFRYKLALTAAVAGSTYYLRSILGVIGLQALTFLLPVVAAAYLFGSAWATLAAVLSISVAHLVLWLEDSGVLFTRPYFVGILNFALFSLLIILYSYRHERVLSRLDESLERERAARQEAEDASRLKDQFLATLSHELRTPINVILGYLEMLLGGRARDPRKALEVAHRNARQQAQLIEDVLDVSRLTTGIVQLNVEPVDPVAIVREAVESLQPAVVAKGLTLRVAPAEKEVCILADPQRLRQVFWNILSNAVKFTPAGGSVTARTTVGHGHVEISVQDTGRGISREFLPHVFDMFRQGDPSTTRDASGIGLGLTIVKRFVELQGGTVSAHSPGEGQGATFVCRFPIHRDPAAASAPGAVGRFVPSGTA